MNSANTNYFRIVAKIVSRVIAGAMFLSLALGGIGLIISDRIRLIAPLIYVPLVLIAPAAIAFDLLLRGRTFGPRFGLSIFAAIIGFSSACSLGFRFTSPNWPCDRIENSSATANAKPLRVLQWNVRWGGRTPDVWESICGRIIAAKPDLILLSESPSPEKVKFLATQLGPQWNIVTDYRGDPRFRSATAVLAPARVEIKSLGNIPWGRITEVQISPQDPTADMHENPHADFPSLHVLMVDGTSDIFSDRRMRLGGVMIAIEKALASNEPFDIVAGDFNSIGKSSGFSRLHETGYLDAGNMSRWRPTWPSFLPIYDIDHVLVSPRWCVESRATVSQSWCDHLGQIVVIK